MTHKYIFDTHALVWFLEGNSRLGQKAKAVMEADDSYMVLPIIALSEATLLIERGRIGIPTVSDLLSDVREDERIEIFPLTWGVFERCLTEEGMSIPELHDRFIVSTGLHLQDLGDTISIITRDESIQEAGVLPVIWG